MDDLLTTAAAPAVGASTALRCTLTDCSTKVIRHGVWSSHMRII